MEKIKNKEGFTLLEVIFAISILTVGILAVGAMQTSSIRGNAFAWSTTEASSVAMAKMEDLMNVSYNDLTGDGGVPDIEGRYTINWAVTPDFPIANTTTITVTVSWKDHALNRSMVLSTLIGRTA